MAELLVSQGFVARAVDVYEELARRNPSDPAIAARLTEVRGMLTANTDANPHADVRRPMNDERVRRRRRGCLSRDSFG
jgi:hypothetical protein